jgi:hypothetical protein
MKDPTKFIYKVLTIIVIDLLKYEYVHYHTFSGTELSRAAPATDTFQYYTVKGQDFMSLHFKMRFYSTLQHKILIFRNAITALLL